MQLRKLRPLVILYFCFVLTACGETQEVLENNNSQPETEAVAVAVGRPDEVISKDNENKIDYAIDTAGLLEACEEAEGTMFASYYCKGQKGNIVICLFAEERTDSSGRSCGSTFGKAVMAVDGEIVDDYCWSAISPWDSNNLKEFYVNIDEFEDGKVSYTQYLFDYVQDNECTYEVNEYSL